MANPQKENGYTPIANDIMDALVGIRIPGEARQMLDFVLRKTYGWGKPSDNISVSQFQAATGIKKPNLIRARKILLEMNLIIIKKDNDIPEYRINKDFETWAPLSKKITLSKKIIVVIEKDNLPLSKKIPTKTILTKTTLTKTNIGELEKCMNEKLKLTLGTKNKKEAEKLIKLHGIDQMVEAIERVRLYFTEAKMRGWKKYVIGKHPGNIFEKISYFLSDDEFTDRLEKMMQWNKGEVGGTYHNPEDQSKYFEGIDDM